ncbi:enoyl-CoA hydratase/isomerase family protein [Pseudomonas sp. F1_0610]|uniref:enoyl-CoA hydratase/isomerase family protein n=1 Tax=Pseudomonas sp. F1_0610 TaxID=3114284 RepID=UPI0039C2E7FA
MSDSALVLAQVRNHVGHLTLNRAASLNSLNLEMVRLLQQQLSAWADDAKVYAVVLRAEGEKAFCAGGDIRALYDNHLAGNKDNETFFSEEYALDLFIHNYNKPVVALMDGYVLGGGMGLVQGASFRVISENTRMGMPETGIGYFPDVGGSYFLSRLADHIGTYMAITGNPIKAADALAVGLADWHLPKEQFAEFDRCLDHMSWNGHPNEAIRSLLETLAHKTMDGSELLKLKPAIKKHFSVADAKTIYHSLKNETDPSYAQWAEKIVNTLDSRSPLALATAIELVKRGAQLSLENCFNLEFHLDCIWFDQGDIMEGVRALIVDKDKNPKWQHAHIDDVQQEQVQALFAGFTPSL